MRCTVVVTLLSSFLATPHVQAQAAAQPDWSAVENAIGRKGGLQPGDVIKFSFPRSDLSVTVNGVTLKPALALGSWVAFKESASGQAMVMGDLVLTDTEVNAVMTALQDGGVEQTALHNHVLNETPHVMYMHIGAHGNAVAIATTIRKALGMSATPTAPPAAGGASGSPDLDTLAIAKALGVSGRLNGAVYQVSVPRTEKIMEMGREVPPSMGVATAINFQPTGGGKAAISGDFVLTGAEVNPVIRALKKAGIDVTALHSHLIDESPRLYFMHFWANDNAVKLATGLHSALALTKSQH